MAGWVLEMVVNGGKYMGGLRERTGDGNAIDFRVVV